MIKVKMPSLPSWCNKFLYDKSLVLGLDHFDRFFFVLFLSQFSLSSLPNKHCLLHWGFDSELNNRERGESGENIALLRPR